MWYFQISNDMGKVLYSQGSGILPEASKPLKIVQSMFHTMNLAIKHSINDGCSIQSENVIAALKHFAYNNENIYFAVGFECENEEINLIDANEIIINGIFQTIHDCLIMMYGYKSIFNCQEEEKEGISKKIKVSFYLFLVKIMRGFSILL